MWSNTFINESRGKNVKRILKVLAMAFLAAGLKAISDTLPNVLPVELAGPVAVGIAAAIGYRLPAPKP